MACWRWRSLPAGLEVRVALAGLADRVVLGDSLAVPEVLAVAVVLVARVA